MATLQDAIDQIQTAVGAVSGIRVAPDEPAERWAVFPVAVCYAGSGVWKLGTVGGASSEMKGIHDLVLNLFVARKELTRDVQHVMSYAKSVPNAILDAYQDGTLTGLEAMGPIEYTFGAITWGGQELLGFQYILTQCKTQDVIT